MLRDPRPTGAAGRSSDYRVGVRRRGVGDLLAGRVVSTGSVFSTLLIASAIEGAADSVQVERLVDVGCGDSPYRSMVRHRRYVGIDRSPSAPPGEIVVADAASLPLRDAMSDGVLCTEVIEHVADERVLLAELARVAAPGGRLVLSSPFVHGLHEQPYDFRRLTSIGLVTLLDEAGWVLDEIRPIGGPAAVLLDGVSRWTNSMFRRIARRLAREGSRTHELLVAPSARLQHALALAVLRAGRHLGPMDPMRANPRLTLGYVVLATRRVA